MINSINIAAIFPELFLASTTLALLIIGVIRGEKAFFNQIKMAKLTLVITGLLVLSSPITSGTSFNGMFAINGFTTFCKILIILGSLFALFLSSGFYRTNIKQTINEFPILVLLATLGMLLMVSANSLLSLYMGLELQSLALYILASIRRDNEKSSEAGLKYFVLGALSSGILLYGCSLIYGFSGTLNFTSLALLYNESANFPLGALIGLIFVITALCFKVSAVPFHMWTPDVYEGSPTPVTAFFAVAPKIAAIALFVRVLMQPFADMAEQWQQVIILVSTLSMVIGALGAIQQSNIKRLIAYSSIGHVGYILVGLASASNEGVKAILLYLTIYMTLSIGIFACIMLVRRKEGNSYDIASLSGLSKTRPGLAIIIAIIMLSMAGIPPFAGFFGKFFVFFAAIKAELYVLAVIGVLSSVIAAFYYLRIIKIMYIDEAVVSLEKDVQPELKYLAFAAALFNVVFFVFATPFLQYAESAAVWLF